MQTLTIVHLKAFEAKIIEVEAAHKETSMNSFEKDYKSCFNTFTNELNEDVFKTTRKESMKNEDRVMREGWEIVANLKIAIEECKKQIAITKALSYISIEIE